MQKYLGDTEDPKQKEWKEAGSNPGKSPASGRLTPPGVRTCREETLPFLGPSSPAAGSRGLQLVIPAGPGSLQREECAATSSDSHQDPDSISQGIQHYTDDNTQPGR